MEASTQTLVAKPETSDQENSSGPSLRPSPTGPKTASQLVGGGSNEIQYQSPSLDFGDPVGTGDASDGRSQFDLG